jgi:uncharacterized protein YceH (UPF0502 family)
VGRPCGWATAKRARRRTHVAERAAVSAPGRAGARISQLQAEEVRVLGCLLEKQRTTPDAYPLSLNALRLACNQSTNRDPVVDYDEALLRGALHRLERRGLVRLASGAGSRAAKYRHLLADALPLDGGEQAVMCVLMLRGAQTPGELKQRTERMHAFSELADVHRTLDALIGRGLVERQPRRPGQKEERYLQLLEADGEEASSSPSSSPAPDEPAALPSPSADGLHGVPPTAPRSELEELRERVGRLEREVAEMRAAMRDPYGQSGE